MGKRKYDVDLNALFSIKVLMGMGEVENWKDAEILYSKMTGAEIPSSYLMSYSEKITGKEINTRLVERFLSSYQKEVEKPLDYDPNKTLKLSGNTSVEYNLDNGAKTVQVALGITDEEKEDLFGIEDGDDGLTEKNKILKKINEPNYLLEYLNLDPNRFFIEKIEPGAWSVAMKLKVDKEHDLPVIVTNDKLSITIKQNPNITKDYIDLASQLADKYKDKLKTIEFPNIVSSENLKDFRDFLVTQNIGDLHTGGLTHWTETSFDNWDSKKASYVQHLITDYIIQKQQNDWRAKTLYIVYNGDILDIDNLFNKTSSMSKHTMQTDSRWNKIFSDQLSTILYSLVKLSPNFDDIYVDFNRGNHDKQTMDALFLAISTSILMSKVGNIHTKYDDSALLKESVFPWGKHLFISDHGELSDKALLQNLQVKYGELMRQYPYINITANHIHQFGVTPVGDTLIFREPSLCPVTSYEADYTTLNGKANAAQMFKIWEKDKRFPQISSFELERKSLWKDEDIDPPKIAPSNMEELQKSFFEQGLMSPTPRQVDLARYYKSIVEKAKEGFQSKGIDTTKLTERDIINMAQSIGAEIPMTLRTEDQDFVINNMPKILSLGKSSKS